MKPAGPREAEGGYSLVALVASITIMLILMSAGVPTWRYIMKDDREEELLFRGGQIADAIAAYQKKNGNALPASLEVLVKARFLRKPFKDPMTKDGKWRFIRQGETIAPITVPGAQGGAGVPGAAGISPPPTTRPPGPGVSTGFALGGIIGVATTSREKSLRVFNGRSRYDEWIFAAGQPRVVGKPMGLVPPPGGLRPQGGPSIAPGARPTPLPAPSPR
jgi:type II secretory pathway pseudopilin PulG